MQSSTVNVASTSTSACRTSQNLDLSSYIGILCVMPNGIHILTMKSVIFYKRTRNSWTWPPWFSLSTIVHEMRSFAEYFVFESSVRLRLDIHSRTMASCNLLCCCSMAQSASQSNYLKNKSAEYLVQAQSDKKISHLLTSSQVWER